MVRSCLWELLPYAAMVVAECLDVGLTTLSKAALSRGMSHFVFVFYSNALATLIIFPCYFIFRRTKSPPLTLPLLFRFFLLGLTGITIMQNCVFTGINYSSPTLGSAMGNLIPAFTFILALIFRMEKLDLRSSTSQARLMGTLISISGALIITLYKGSPIGLSTLSSSSHQHHDPLPISSPSNSLATAENWVLGGLFLAAASLSASIWTTLQADTVKGYPAELTIVSFNCLFGTIQCGIVSLIAERGDLSVWNLRPDIELISIMYSALFGTVVTCSIQTWCIHKKGPVFVSLFKPLSISIAAIMGVIFLGDTLYVGSVVGAIVIAFGFYGAMWGQAKEEKKGEDNGVRNLESSAQIAPLLQRRWL